MLPLGRCGTSDASGPLFVAGAVLCRPGQKSGWDLGKTSIFACSMFIFVLRGMFCDHLTCACATLWWLCACQIALVVARCEVRDHSRNSLITLCVSDGSRCGATCGITRRTFSSLCACRIALAVVRNKFWDPSGNLLGTLCMYDRSSCGAVLIIAASLRFWYRDLLNSFEDLARVSWRSLAGPWYLHSTLIC